MKRLCSPWALAFFLLVQLAANAWVLAADGESASKALTPSERRLALQKLLDRPRVPLDPQLKSSMPLGGDLIEERLSIATEKKANGDVERMPILLVKPAYGPATAVARLPVVIVLHGTGGNKEGQK